MDTIKQHILQKYNLSPDTLLSKGMEAEVYAYGTDAVLKLYSGITDLAYLTILKNFYDSLSHYTVSFALPYIRTISEENGFLVTIEQRLYGTCMSVVLPNLTKLQLDHMMQTYLAAALELSNIQAPPDLDRYKLFDTEGISQRTNGDWHQFLARYLTHNLAQVTHYLTRDVLNFAMKVQHMRSILAQPYTSGSYLIHGDFFPGNLLIDDDHHVTALLDFGLLTMYGDPLFDIATGWVFFDMYDELKANVRDHYLSVILERLGESARGKLYRYVLLYSILSANTYSSQCADGHYHWCIANLNNQEYWNNVE